MRLIETIHLNKSVRTYSVDKKLTDQNYITSLRNAEKEGNLFKKFYEELLSIPLVEDVYVSKYEIRIGVLEAFADESYTWDCVESGVSNALKQWHGESVVYTSAKVKQDELNKKKKDEEQARIKEVPEVFNEILNNRFTIPHDFRTHRDAWRNALVMCKVSSENSLENWDDDNNDPEIASANVSYWEHELKAFDTAFEALLALNLPET